MATDKVVLIDERLARAVEQWAVTDDATCKALAQEALIVLGIRKDEISSLNTLIDTMDKQIGALQHRNDNLLTELRESQQSELKARKNALSRDEVFDLLNHLQFTLQAVTEASMYDAQGAMTIFDRAITNIRVALTDYDDIPF